MADQKISALPALTGDVALADVLPVVDASASETKKVSAKHLLESTFALVDDDSIPLDKVDTSGLTVAVPDGSITAAKLADNSSAIYGTLPATGDFQGQIAVEASTKEAYVWSGAAWEKQAGVTATNASGAAPIVVADSLSTDGTLSIAVGIEDTTASRQFLAGPTSSPGAVSARQIIGADLPPATAASLGGVSAGTGLAVSGTGSLSIANSVAPSTVSHVVQYDAQGLITNGRELEGSDLPIATDTNPGVVSAGRGLSMGVDGALDITNQITPATGTKFTVDAQGCVTDVLVLTEADIPEIPADKIVGGDLNGTLLADRSVDEIKLADYSTCYIQEGQPSSDPKLGQFWFTPSTNQLRVFTRGSASDRWESIGFGALQTQNLRWAGTVDASNSTILTLTDIGISEGLTSGSPIPTPTDELSGLYFVVQVAGNGITIPNVSGATCTEGDWILYVDQAQGAIHLNISAGGGGGGGGASRLNDLLDVSISNPTVDQFLQFDDITATWKNSSTIDGGQF